MWLAGWMSETTRITVSRLIDAPAADIFDILSNPERHPETDASGMVVSDQKTDPIAAVGDVFRMNMRYDDGAGHVEDYQTDNHVSGFIPNKLIAWKPGLVDEAEPLGWEWLYELEPEGSHATQVSLTYDWTNTGKDEIAQYGVPAFTEGDLEASLGRLAEAVLA